MEAAIRECAPEVREVTDFHIWEFTSQMYALGAHLKVCEEAMVQLGRDLASRLSAVL